MQVFFNKFVLNQASIGLLHLKIQSNFSCCESLFVHNTCTW